MIDPISYAWWFSRNAPSPGKETPGDTNLRDNAAWATMPFRICACDWCEELIYQHAAQPKFFGYSKFDPHLVEELTEHQYFICHCSVNAFLFKTRAWGEFPCPLRTYASVL